MSFTGCPTADSQWLFIALSEMGDPATMTICADEDELLAAVKDAMYFTPEGEEMSVDDVEHCKAIMAELLEDGCVTFEGDPGLHLYRVWKTREQALADVRGVKPVQAPSTEYVLVRLKRPEGYEDVHPDLVLADAGINPAFEPEIVPRGVMEVKRG